MVVDGEPNAENTMENVDVLDEDESEDDGETLKPLPNILSCIVETISETKGRGNNTVDEKYSDHENDLEDGMEPELQKFVEPEAPPNSVKRVEKTIQEYDDDFLKTTEESEGIKLF